MRKRIGPRKRGKGQPKVKRRIKRRIRPENIVVRPPGRPSAYREEYAGQARKLAKNGATRFELADFFGVSGVTIDNWCVAHAEFLEAIKLGRETSDNRAELRLYDKAMGYTFESEKIVVIGRAVERVPILEHVPPSDVALIMWLANRRPDKWRRNPDDDRGGGKVVVEIRNGFSGTDPQGVSVGRTDDNAAATPRGPAEGV